MSRAGQDNGVNSTRNQIFFFALGIVFYALAGVHFLNHAPDDVFITLRYAQNVADGQGPVYNAGERVEGASNPVWLALLAALQPVLQTPTRMVLAAKWLSLLGGLLALLIAAGLARSDPEGAEYWGLAPFLIGLSGYFAYWSAAGMETGLHLFLLAAALGAYIRALETRRRAWRVLAGLPFALLLLSRPEAPIFFAAVVVGRGLLIWRDRQKPDWADAGFVALALTPLAAFFLWRHAYYGAWWPNTFYAKAGGGLATWLDGARYLLRAIGPACWGNALAAGLLAVVLIPWRRCTARSLLLWLGVTAQAGFVVLGGGDWMPGWRFAVPAVLLLALLAPAALARWRQAIHTTRWEAWFGGGRKWLWLALLALAAGSHLYAVKQLGYWPSGWRTGMAAQFYSPAHKEAADWLSAHAEKDDWLATGEAGLIPYLTGLPTIDCFGLTDAHLARVPGKRHEKVDPDYILGRKPRFLVIGGARRTAAGLSSDFAYGRSLLAHAQVERDYTVVYDRGSFLILQRRAQTD